MPSRRAIRKKMQKKFRPGDVVTWGQGVRSHRVLAVRPTGILVDSTSSGFGRLGSDGRRTILVEFSPASRSHRCFGPPWHATFPPDEDTGALPDEVLARRTREATRRRAELGSGGESPESGR